MDIPTGNNLGVIAYALRNSDPEQDREGVEEVHPLPCGPTFTQLAQVPLLLAKYKREEGKIQVLLRSKLKHDSTMFLSLLTRVSHVTGLKVKA